MVPHAYLYMESKYNSYIVDFSRAVGPFPTRDQTSSSLTPQCLRCCLQTAWLLVGKKKKKRELIKQRLVWAQPTGRC